MAETLLSLQGATPRWPVDHCLAAHAAGELCLEQGKIGAMVEQNDVGGPNTLIERCWVLLPVQAGTAPGSRLYYTGPLTPGVTLQAPPQKTVQVAPTLAVAPPDPPPSAAPVVGVPEAGGAVDAGTHLYAVSYLTTGGETTYGPAASVTVTPGAGIVPLSALPTGSAVVTGRRLWRTHANTAGPFYLLAALGDVTTTTYVDVVPDAALVQTSPVGGVLVGVVQKTPSAYGATLAGLVDLAPFPLS